MTRKRTGKPRHTVKPLSIAAFEGPEYGLYYLASKSYTGYWPCHIFLLRFLHFCDPYCFLRRLCFRRIKSNAEGVTVVYRTIQVGSGVAYYLLCAAFMKILVVLFYSGYGHALIAEKLFHNCAFV